ncbi:MAG: PEGA domain-containing protein [Magnetococcales bacterium]|nr:PEGA domain-containing protein [Magnetococcales bacterium]
MNAMIRRILTFSRARPSIANGLRTRLFSMSGGALLTATILWLAVATPPMAAPSPPAETTVGATMPAATEAAVPMANLPAPPPPESAGNPSETLLLRIETKPPGATIFLDGQQLGTTPFTVGRVKIGMHALRLEKEHFSPVSYDLELNEDTVVDLTLDSLPTPPTAPHGAAQGRLLGREDHRHRGADRQQESGAGCLPHHPRHLGCGPFGTPRHPNPGQGSHRQGERRQGARFEGVDGQGDGSQGAGRP